MPQFSFTPTQVDALVECAAFAQRTGTDYPGGKTVPALPPSHYEPAGNAGQLISDLNCFSCHAINGRGGDMAPDLTWEGSSVQREWLVQFFRNPNTLAASADPPHAKVQSDRRGDQHSDRLHSDGLSIAQGGPGFDAADRISAGAGRAGETTLLLEVRMPGVPHHRLRNKTRDTSARR